MLDRSSRSRVTGRSGGGDRDGCERSWREIRKRSMKLRVDLLCMDEIETMQVGEDVCCLLE